MSPVPSLQLFVNKLRKELQRKAQSCTEANNTGYVNISGFVPMLYLLQFPILVLATGNPFPYRIAVLQ